MFTAGGGGCRIRDFLFPVHARILSQYYGSALRAGTACSIFDCVCAAQEHEDEVQVYQVSKSRLRATIEYPKLL